MKKILNILFVLVLALGIAIVPTIVPSQTHRVAAEEASTVLVDNLLASWTGAGGGGVYSWYCPPGPFPYYSTLYSPGTTALYLGREAGIIKAGLTVDPDDGHYWDDGGFGFRDSLGTIDALAAGTLSYDVVNQEGTNPVWMTIEIDTGVVGNRSDDTTYQHVPTTNPAGWHTVDAAAGLWQKWNNYEGDTTGNPKISLSAVAANHTGLNVTRVYLRLGMGDSYHGTGNGTIGWVDKVTIGTVTYDFVLPRYWYVAKTGSDTNEGTEASPFLTIQKAVDSANVTENTIHVAAGTYQEQVVINKNLTLVGTGDPVIQAPASPTKFKFPESGAWWDPVVFAFGGTNAGGTISGAGTVTVSISGFTVDGNNRVPYDRAAGILFRNAGGNITDNTVQNMCIDGKQTFGIIAYGNSDMEITGNDVSGYSKGGIGANGDNVLGPPSYPTPHAVIEGNTVTGPGNVSVTNAPNGIQIGWGATGKIIGNAVSGNGWPGTAWTGSGIIVAGADDVEVGGNDVHDETGIAVCGWMWAPSGVIAERTWIHHNTVDGNTYGISIQDKSVNTTIEYNTIKNSSYDGIDICNFYGYAPTGTVIQHNSIIDNNAEDDSTSGGIWIDDGVDGNEVAVHLNNIVDNNAFGIINTSTNNNVSATYNWWGSSSGPYHATKNPSGTGDAVSDYVDFEPWLVVENPTVTTQAATSITTTTATLNMSFTVGGYASVYVRFAYKKSADSTWSYTGWVAKSASGTHAASIAGLSSNTQYDFKAQLKYNDVEFGETTLDGATLHFTTLRTPPTVTTQAATDVVLFHAILHMSYTVGDYSPVQVRFAYKKSAGTTWSYTSWVSKGADGTDSAQIILMVASATQYDFKAQLKYDGTVTDGTTLHFTTAIISGCFIATAAYGTPTAKQIDVLRAFRDDVLLKSTVGSRLVDLYYRLSPPVANFIAGNELLRTLVRDLLVDPIVRIVEATGGIWQN
jgi:hypothetical protein